MPNQLKNQENLLLEIQIFSLLTPLLNDELKTTLAHSFVRTYKNSQNEFIKEGISS